MTYRINAKHLTNVQQLPAGERYDYFVKRVADWQEAWTVEGDRGWLTGTDDEGVIHVPLWAHPLFAEMCATGNCSNGRIMRVGLRELTDKMLPQLESDHYRVSVMPIPPGTGVPVEPGRLRKDLLSELAKIE